MVLLVDAYNFLKTKHAQSFLQPHIIKQEISIFVSYAQWRNNEVVLVFDGGDGLYEHCEKKHRLVQCCYAGTLQSADDMLKSYMIRPHYQHSLLITSDQEIRKFAQARSVVSMSSHDFEPIFRYLMQQKKSLSKKKMGTLYKTTQESDPYVDALMEQGSQGLAHQHDLGHDMYTVDLPLYYYQKQNKKLCKKLLQL